jgi:hypothetical protein
MQEVSQFLDRSSSIYNARARLNCARPRENQIKMFVKIGTYTINTDHIIHIKHEDDNDTATVVFVDGSSVQWKAEDSIRLRQILDRMGGM